MRRLGLALGAYGLIAVVALATLPAKMSVVVLLLMALLAFKSVVHRNHTMRTDEEARTSNAELEGRE
jgi:uncharacterized membrane protein YccF (DUF307 family)